MVYAAEADRVLREGWLPLCRTDQLRELGSHVAVTLIGRPVIAVRDGVGEIRVLANVCAHRVPPRSSTTESDRAPSPSCARTTGGRTGSMAR